MKCKVIASQCLQREVEHGSVVSHQDLDVVFVEPGSDSLQQELEKLSGENLDAVILAVGLQSLGEDGLLNSLSVPLVLPRAHDEFSILLGSAQRYRQLQEEAACSVYFYHDYSARHGVLDTLNAVKRGADVVCAITTLFTDPVEDWRAATQIAHEKQASYIERAASLGLIVRLLDGQWLADEVLVVEPGQRVEASFHADIIRAVDTASR